MMIDADQLYPLLFKPIYKQVMWGGDMLGTKLGRVLPETDVPIGESWDVSDREDGQSEVENGPLAGTTLRALLQAHGKSIVGDSYDGGPFPLLVKIIDAGQRLSLQVHPDEAACARIGGTAEPKTEMWYIISAKPDAKIIAGMLGSTTQRHFVDRVSSPDVEDCLQIFDSQPGDAYFINAGRIHAIAAGNLLLEVQQNSNTTYRVSDWGRVDANGKSRELHVEQALECIDFMDRSSPRISGVSDKTDRNRKYPIINQCRFFKVDDLRLVDTWQDNTGTTKSFHLITPINGSVRVGRDGTDVEVCAGTTCLIPACFGAYTISLCDGHETKVIRTSL